MLNTFERKMLRRIYGPTHEGGCWRSRWNNKLYSLYNEPNIVEDIKIRRLEWAGHIIRMEVERRNFHTTRTVGRQRIRWADVVQRDALQLLGIRGWRSRAANRGEFEAFYENGQGSKGTVAQWMDEWMDEWMDGWMDYLYRILE
jgi:hypothetical protein